MANIPAVAPRIKSPQLDSFLRDRELESLGIENSSMWAVNGSTYRPCQTADAALPSGEYVIEEHPTMGIIFNKRESKFDNLLRFPDSDSDYVLNNIDHFWASEPKFRDFGFIWKRGVLLFGPPGSGKTSTVQLLAQDVVSRGGCVFYTTHPQLSSVGLYMFRQIEPRRPAVVILEDIDAIIERYGEPELLALLDGELQIDNVVFIATTNYPEKLDQRIINRPSRFDVIKRIGLPNLEARRLYIQTKNHFISDNAEEVERWTKETEGLSIAHLKELIILVQVFEQPFKVALDRLKNMKKALDNNEYEGVGNYL